MKSSVLILLLMLICGLVYCQSAREMYDFQYIVELNESKEDSVLVGEIARFRNLYPKSELGSYITFIEAGVALRSGDPSRSKRLLTRLLDSKENLKIKADVMLAYISASFVIGDYQDSETMIQKLISEAAEPFIIAEAYFVRGQIQQIKEQYYSAELSYRSALVMNPAHSSAKYELFNTLLKLQKTDEARAQISTIDPQLLMNRYAHLWLDYLLDNDLRMEFDNFVSRLTQSQIEMTEEVLLTVVKKLVVDESFSEVLKMTVEFSHDNHYAQYYKGIALAASGNIASADSIFVGLVREADIQVSIFSYFERLKLLYQRDKSRAISQLKAYIEDEENSQFKGNQYYLLAQFCYNAGDTINALKYFVRAQQYDLPAKYFDQSNYLVAYIWFHEGRMDHALQYFNRYLNLFSEGRFRDLAWFYIGYINFQKKEYTMAQRSFLRLIQEFKESSALNEAKFYLAEIDFNQANYKKALAGYLSILDQSPSRSRVVYRIAQAYFYEKQYQDAYGYIIQIPENEYDYETTILKASISFNLRQFDDALRLYQKSEKLGRDQTQKAEAQSYQALVYYQMKRFKEASDLYLKLSGETATPDTYLYLSAKSAFLGRDYRGALDRYNDFIDNYPESKHFLAVLNDLANAYYNLGDFDNAIESWLVIVDRFATKVPLSEQDIKFLTEVLAGLELGLSNEPSGRYLDDILLSIDSIRSDFLKFEIQFILLKLFADRSLWQDLYTQAQEIRKLYPQKQVLDVEYLMADALINLNERSLADSILSKLADTYQSPKVLQRWAELDIINTDFISAITKLTKALSLEPNPLIWTKILELSIEHDPSNFEEKWSLGEGFVSKPAEAEYYYLIHLFQSQRYEEADVVAHHILELHSDPMYHGYAFLTIAKILFMKDEYTEALRILRQLRVLFPEFKDIMSKSYYYNIMILLESGSIGEAKSMFTSEGHFLDQTQRHDIEELLINVPIQR